jgi:SAM-dependent methyltransferase
MLAPTSRGASTSDGPWRIAFVSFVVLSLELSFIRQIPAEVKAISYFTNLILMASFFGLGLGCILQERRSMAWLLPTGVVCVMLFALSGRGIVIHEESRLVHFWLRHEEPAARLLKLPLLPAAMAAFVATALPFVALGQRLVRVMEPHARLVAYGWDIAGSLLGTVAFSATAFLGVPPWVSVAVLLPLWALVMERQLYLRAAVALSGLAFLFFAHSPLEWHWSPYYFVQHRTEPVGLRVFVNSSFHQPAIDFTSQDPMVRQVQSRLLEKWNRPYAFYREHHRGHGPQRVLILGAGTGNDVAVALRQGASAVVAVEIDPVILSLGRTLNRSRPYDDPRVRAVVDDARHFLRSSDETFDMVVFGTLDSQALLSGHANMRLENYVYTRESISDARRRLRPNGLLVVHYSAYERWIMGRIYSTVQTAFSESSFIVTDDDSLLFNTTIVGVNGRSHLEEHPRNLAAFGGKLFTTDDWPFLYIQRPTLPSIYLALLAFVATLTLGVFLSLRALHPVRGQHAHFLFLGLGFTLVESTAIVRLALLFASTWVINAVVFASVLLTIFLANLLVLKGRAPALPVCWTTLFGGLLLNYFFPVSELFAFSTGWRVVIAAVLVGLPVFAAALCFSHLFRGEPVTGYPLGVNLVGAMAGGLIEYSSMATGMRAVWLIAVLVYGAAWLSWWRAKAPGSPHISTA